MRNICCIFFKCWLESGFHGGLNSMKYWKWGGQMSGPNSGRCVYTLNVVINSRDDIAYLIAIHRIGLATLFFLHHFVQHAF